MTLESIFKNRLIRKIQKQYPGALILKMDANYIQGIPDQMILFGDRWAAFEAKRSQSAPHRPNQDFYIDRLDRMSFAQFVYPENEKEFLDELQYALQPPK